MKKVINPANKNLKKRIMDYIRTNNVSGTLNTQTIAKHLEVERSAVENTLNYMSHPEKGGKELQGFFCAASFPEHLSCLLDLSNQRSKGPIGNPVGSYGYGGTYH